MFEPPDIFPYLEMPPHCRVSFAGRFPAFRSTIRNFLPTRIAVSDGRISADESLAAVE